MREFPGTAPGLIGLREKPRASQSHRDPWEKSRVAESMRHNQTEHMLERKNSELRSQWEQRTRDSMIEAETQRRYMAIKEKEFLEREKHKEQLHKLLLEEEQQCVMKQKTPAEEARERYEQSRRQAEQLERERKEANRRIAEEKYAQQFREGCDLLREELSRRKAYEIAEDRRVQIAMKQQQQKQRKADEAAYIADLMKQQEQVQDSDRIKKLENSKLLAEHLEKQVMEKQRAKVQAEEIKQKERQSLNKLQQELQEETIKQHQHKMEQRAKIKEELDACLRDKREQMNKELETIRAYELLLSKQEEELAYADASEHKQAKQRAHKEALQYLEYVRQSRLETAALEKSVNQVVEEAIEQQAKRVHQARQREKAARESLAQETAKCRQQQIREKDEVRRKLAEEKQKIALELKETMEREKQKAAEEVQRQQDRLIEYRLFLEAQIAHQHQFNAKALEEAEKERKAEQEIEANMRARIDELLCSEVGDTNRHPWRIMLAQGHPGIPRWTGSLKSSHFVTGAH